MPRRTREWTDAKAVIFIVTLATRRFVTLAAPRAGMSRKSGYALRARDPVFAAAWNAGEQGVRQGDKGDEVLNRLLDSLWVTASRSKPVAQRLPA